jgi:hypothetical protein
LTGALRAVYRYALPIFFLALVVQVFLAGLGAFGVAEEAAAGSVDEEGVDDEFVAHAVLGFLLLLASILLFLIALGARLGRNRVLLTLALPVLLFVQLILGGGGQEAPVVGALHPVNALVILGLTGYLAYGAWRRWTDLGAPTRA